MIPVAERVKRLPALTLVENPHIPSALRTHPGLNLFKELFQKGLPTAQEKVVKMQKTDPEKAAVIRANMPYDSITVTRIGDTQDRIRFSWKGSNDDGITRTVIGTVSRSSREFNLVEVAVVCRKEETGRWHNDLTIQENMPPLILERLGDAMTDSILKAASLQEQDLDRQHSAPRAQTVFPTFAN